MARGPASALHGNHTTKVPSATLRDFLGHTDTVLALADGAKALTKVIRATFGRHTPIQRCQIHKARNVIERLPKPLHASVRKALRQAWELDDADRAERLLRNPARRLEHEAPGAAGRILRRDRRDADRQSPRTTGTAFGARSPAPTQSKT